MASSLSPDRDIGQPGPLATPIRLSHNRGMEMFRQSRALMEAEIADELVALDVGRDLCFGFNQPAAAIWQLLATPKSTDELVERLSADFDVDRATCAADVAQLLTDLQRLKLVEQS